MACDDLLLLGYRMCCVSPHSAKMNFISPTDPRTQLHLFCEADPFLMNAHEKDNLQIGLPPLTQAAKVADLWEMESKTEGCRTLSDV